MKSIKLSALMLGVAVGVMAFSQAGLADTSGKRIALSNNYAGNSWRQAMLKSWEKVGTKAVADGVVAAADAFTHGREPGDRAGGSDPEPDHPGL